MKVELVKPDNSRTLLELLRDKGINIRSDCGGSGVCGKCVIKVLTGAFSESSLSELRLLGDQMLREGFRLACQTRLASSRALIEIPELSLATSFKSADVGFEKPFKLSPLVRKYFLKISPPSLEDQKSDLSRLSSHQEVSRVSLRLLRLLPKVLRECGWEVTVTLRGKELLDIECGNKENNLYGLAIDVGTSRVVAHLLDLSSGDTLAVASSPNPQQVFGSDVMSRIAHAIGNVEYLEKLRQDIITSINELLRKASSSAGVRPENIYEIVVVGNTVMTHLLLGVDPSTLGIAPYTPVFTQGLEFRSNEVGIRANPNSYVYVAPSIAGFVGGDAVADALAVGLDECVEPCVLLDIGTNTEVLVSNGVEIYATSAPAGPAFEGFGTRHGVRAVDGAVSKIFMYFNEFSGDYDVRYEVIGRVKPLGICGSAYIDALAHLYKHKIIDERGRFKDVASKRLKKGVEHKFVIVWSSESGTGEDIAIYSEDIESILLAKAAIASATQLILKKAGLTPEEVGRVFIAGSFGTSLNVENAAIIGLIPRVWISKTTFVGNTAISGAKLILKSSEAREKAGEIARKTKYVEISADKEFTKIYVKNLFLPP
ncbi:MAG: ASKHA domain-containing protein [Zestosphaera sp.]